MGSPAQLVVQPGERDAEDDADEPVGRGVHLSAPPVQLEGDDADDDAEDVLLGEAH
jgi:hypothetical protein